MSNGTLLVLTFIIGTIIMIVGLVNYWNDTKNQGIEYPELIERFKVLAQSTNYGEIIEVGTKLIYNKHLKQEHLTLIYQTSIKLEHWHPDFTRLKLAAFNKQLHYDRPVESGLGYY